MPQLPDSLVLERHRDLEGTLRGELWWRRAILTGIALISVFGLANVFGQHPQTLSAEAPPATLQVYAPAHLRGGLLAEARFEIRARQELKRATIVLDPGWAEGITINTIEPSPLGEASRDGRLALELGHIARGSRYLLFIQFQVNPTTIGRRSQGVELDDGDRRILRVDRTVTIFP